jgi:oligopeptide transport system ATP-binding protein
MYLGRIVELADRDALYGAPMHPYSQALLSAVPEPDPKSESRRQRIVLTGDVPSPSNPPKGCAFSTRCPQVMPQCRVTAPVLTEAAPGRQVACHLYTNNHSIAELTAAP